MNGEQTVYITPEGLEKIKEELEYLTGVKRVELAERLQKAISMGDLSENADYDYAKQEQAFVEGRIRILEDSLRRAQVIENDGPSHVVRVGSVVTIVDEAFGEEETYHIVGIHEADPGNGRISNESPFGRALLGAKVGQVVTVETPRGHTRVKVHLVE